MDFKQWLTEMPIGKAELRGKWDKFPPGKKQHQNWDKASYNILTHDEDLKRLKNRWRRVKQTFDMYFVKNPKMRKHLLQGEVDEEYLQQLGIDIPEINRENITLFLTSNLGGDQVPMTPWTVGHRFGHTVARLDSYQNFSNVVNHDFAEIMKMIYEKERVTPFSYDPGGNNYQHYQDIMKQLMMAFGSMRSARTKNLSNNQESRTFWTTYLKWQNHIPKRSA